MSQKWCIFTYTKNACVLCVFLSPSGAELTVEEDARPVEDKLADLLENFVSAANVMGGGLSFNAMAQDMKSAKSKGKEKENRKRKARRRQEAPWLKDAQFMVLANKHG